LAAFAACARGHIFTFRLLNTAFITLIPKKIDAKLVGEVLANRLAPLLPSIASINQSAFVRGRNIHDNYIFVQQMVKALHKKKEAHVLLKLDISKAFDSVSWPFLLEVIEYVGFSRRWCDLISLLLSTSSTRILVSMGNLVCLLSINEAYGKVIHSLPCSSFLLWML
jgi:hypothetical protein